jgi:hypothetical protein
MRYKYESSIINYIPTSTGKGFGAQNDYRDRLSYLGSIPTHTGDGGVREGVRLSSPGMAFEFLMLLLLVVVVVSVVEVRAPHWQLVRSLMDYMLD